MIFTKLARATSLCGPLLLALLLPQAAWAASDNFNGGAVGNCSYDSPSKTYSCSALSTSNDIAIASGYTVVLTGSINFDFNQQLNMSGSARLQTTGSLDIGNIKPSNLNISGGTLAAGTNFKIGNQAQTITANVTAATMTVGTGSNTKITGTLTATGQIDLGSHATIVGAVSATVVTTNSPVVITGAVDASTSFQLASGSTLTGNLTSPKVALDPSSVTVTGSITAATSISIGSGNTVNGAITGGTLSMASSNVTVNGNVTMTGDVSIGSNGTINGDLAARNVTTQSSGDYISGNAAVNAIYLDYGARVGKTITCTGAGASGCSCVTRADSSYTPTCGAAAPSGPHHILITHGGSALTCQAQNVTLRACADANCSTTYTGGTSVTLTPGGGTVSFSGSTTATVRQTTVGTATLSTSLATTCMNSSTNQASCAMDFRDNGLEVSAPDHVSMTSAQLMVQALKSGPGNASCVPLLQGTVPVKFGCTYMNPTAARSIPVTINGTDVSCGASSTDVSLNFNSAGLATPTLQYAEAGQVGINARYVGSGGNANLAASGSDDFVAAPASFKIEALTPAGVNLGAVARASDSFTLAISAVNALGQTTYNFGKELSPESFSPGEKIKLPSDGVNAIVMGQFDAIVDGVSKSKTGTAGLWTFGESGTITLDAKLTNTSSYYLGRNVTGFNTKGTLDLRFVPHHFDTALVTGIPMSCTGLGGATNPCAPLNTSGSFIYSKQGFYLKVQAYKDAASAPASLSQNYRVKTVTADSASVAKDITLTAWTTAGGATAVPLTAIKAIADKNAIKFTFANGVGSVSSAILPVLEMAATPPIPITAFLRATDDDGATSLRTGAIEAPLTVVSGRIQVANTYGSANSPMPVELRAQYYSGAASAYVANSQFSPVSPAVGADVSLALANVTYANCTPTLDCSALKLQLPSTLSFKNGKALISLATTKASGSANVSLGTVIPYLPAPEPGRATFGIYRSGPVIYTREVHN
jgi:MSHA biogenesis protein MshQ